MDKIKLFEDRTLQGLQDQVNKWIHAKYGLRAGIRPEFSIKQIQYSTFINEGDHDRYSVLIWYKEVE
jgi:hypothetical protein